MKKMLMALAAAGTLAVPAGVALAQEDGAEPTGPVATCEDHLRTQDRDRLNERDSMGEHGQERARQQSRTADGDCTGDGGDQAREHRQVRSEDGTRSQAQHRFGEMGHSHDD